MILKDLVIVENSKIIDISTKVLVKRGDKWYAIKFRMQYERPKDMNDLIWVKYKLTTIKHAFAQMERVSQYHIPQTEKLEMGGPGSGRFLQDEEFHWDRYHPEMQSYEYRLIDVGTGSGPPVQMAKDQQSIEDMILEYSQLVPDDHSLSRAQAIFNYMREKNMTKELGLNFLREISKTIGMHEETELRSYWRKHMLSDSITEQLKKGRNTSMKPSIE